MWYGGGPEQRFIVKKLYVGDVSLQCYGLSEWVWQVGNQATLLKNSEKHDLDTHLTIPLSHLTSCTPTKSNLYLANSLAAAISEPALYKTPNIPSTKSHAPSFAALLVPNISPGPRLCLWLFHNKIRFHGEELLAPRPTPQAGGPPLVGCLRLLIQYIRSYPPHWRPFLNPQPEDAPCRGDRDPLITWYKIKITIIHFNSLLLRLWCVRHHYYFPQNNSELPNTKYKPNIN